MASVIPIDFSSVESLPETHAWSHGCSDIEVAGSVSIPVVDFMDPNAMEAISLACEEWGAFILKNHGIPSILLQKIDEEAEHLFSLPTEQKVKALRPPGGNTGYGGANISPFFPGSMWHEAFTITGSSYDVAEKILADHDHARFRKIVEEIQKQLKIAAEDLTGIILKSIGICDGEKKRFDISRILETVRLNSYPRCPDPDRAIGFVPHTDTSIITFLHQTQTTQEQTSGLQIFKEGIGWVPVHPHPEQLVVLVGEILHILCNGRFPSAFHRVTVSRTAHRYSFAYFQRPTPDTLLSPFGSLPHFRAITPREFDALKAKDPQTALSSISI